VLRWYLIHTKPSAEHVALANLERQGYAVYFPRVVKSVRRRARWRDTVAALFPRYLFLGLQEGQQALAPVNFTAGVAGVVRFGNRYGIVPERIVNDLRSREDPMSGMHRLTGCVPFVPGAQVRITSGPFDGLEGVFAREAGEDRVIVLLNLLGRDTAVHVPAGFVVPNLAWS
jgi:transcriptional antiterminator RfaH